MRSPDHSDDTPAEALPDGFSGLRLKSLDELHAEARAIDERRTEVRTNAHQSYIDLQRKSDRQGTPDYWHGLSINALEDDDAILDRVDRRVTADWKRGLLGKPDMPGTTPSDFNGSHEEGAPRDERRARIIVDDGEAAHQAEHWYYNWPYCPACVGDSDALASARRWVTLHHQGTPRHTWNGETVPGDEDEDETPSKIYYTVVDLAGLQPTAWLLEGLVPQGSLGYITGRDGTWKTFLALDICMSIATQRGHWNGRYIEGVNAHPSVLFLAGEGLGSMGRRIGAWQQHHCIELDPAAEVAPLLVRDGVVNLYVGGEAFDELVARVRAMRPDLVVVDTLRRASGAAEANSARDMGVITDRLEILKRATGGGTVLVIAHTNKGDNDARGSSSIEDDADFVLHVQAVEGRQRITMAKQKDGASGQVVTLQPTPVGDSLILVEPSSFPPLWSSSSPASRILGALRTLAPTGPASQSQIKAVADVDGNDSSMNTGTVSKTIARLVTDGSVLQPRPGIKQYLANLQHPANQLGGIDNYPQNEES